MFHRHTKSYAAGTIIGVITSLWGPATPAVAQTTSSSPLATLAASLSNLLRPVPPPAATTPPPLPPAAAPIPASPAPKIKKTPAERASAVEKAILESFGTDGPQAVKIARCESRLDVGAKNGPHLGLFQMGEAERAKYGHGPDARTQVKAAKRYYQTAGWAPWTKSKKCWA